MAQKIIMSVIVHTCAHNGMGFVIQPSRSICPNTAIFVYRVLVILQKIADISNFFSKTPGEAQFYFHFSYSPYVCPQWYGVCNSSIAPYLPIHEHLCLTGFSNFTEKC